MKEEVRPAREGLRLRGTVGGETALLILREGELTLGGDRGADLPVHSAGVSRRHASLRVTGSIVMVRDLGSKNGTFVNGLRIEEARIAPGDWLQLGPVKLLLEEVDPADAQLGIALERPRAAMSEPASREPDTETSVRGSHEGPSGWLETLEQVCDLVDDGRPGSLHDALDAFVKGVNATGALLLERIPDCEPIVLATAGRLPVARTPAPAGQPEPLLRETHLSGDGSGLVLDVAGDFPGRDRAIPLLRLVLRALAHARPSPIPRARPRPRKADRELRYPPGTVRGKSKSFRDMEHELLALVRNDLPVLLTGETGVGKELVARALHLSSARSEGPFIALNCAAIPAELLEAELFGVARGAATGVSERRGALELAGGGVLLLDEIGDMAIPLQAKLLRALQEREVLPVGAGATRPVDVRVVSATNTDVEARVEAGTFRRDLYYRLAGAVLRVPPLRERSEDIPSLVEHLLARAVRETHRDVRGITVKALEALTGAPWPGNVRQLEHAIRRIVALCPEGQAIGSGLLPGCGESHYACTDGPSPQSRSSSAVNATSSLDQQVEGLERRAIASALEVARGNRSSAARMLGLSRNGLQNKLRRYGLL